MSKSSHGSTQTGKDKKPAAPATPVLQGKRRRAISRADVAWFLALAVVAWLVTGVARDRLWPSTWAVPLQYHNDSLQILGWIKAASEFDYMPFCSKIVHRLGAPFGANWNDYAMYEEFFTFAMGMFARCFGLMQGSNLGIFLCYVPSALAFFVCCRLLRYNRLWSFVAALLFGFTFYNTRRLIFHLLLSFSYVVPLSILVCWLVLASKRLRIGGTWFWFCAGISLLLGTSNPYNLNMFMQLLCFSIVLNWWRERDRNRLKVGLICIGAAAAGFLAMNMDTIWYGHLHGSNPNATPRNYAQTEMNALKPIEMVVPPSYHNSALLGEIGEKYSAVAPIRGEIFSPYLGIIQLACLFWIAGEFIWMLNRRGGKQRVPAHALQGVWVLGYAVIGGVTNLIALAGLYLFRSANRYSIFISALCLFFFASRMSLLARNWKPASQWAVAIALIALGLFDQLTKPTSHVETLQVAQLVQNDVLFGETMEKSLPKGAMVFQLPVMRFPEGGPVHAAQEYEMLRPYYHTKTLRFSFGSNQGRPREDWQFAVEKLSPAEMVKALENYGFSAIYVNRKGYPDGGETLLKQLAAVGKTQVLEDNERLQVCVVLNPSPAPVLPQSDANALLNFKSGWATEDRGQDQVRHWSNGDATMKFFIERSGKTPCHLTGGVASLTPRRVSIEYEGKSIWSGQLGPGQMAPVDVWIDADHGNNTLKFLTDAPAALPPQSTMVAVAFGVINLQVATGSR